MAIVNGRQVGKVVSEIRGDHVKRYEFAAKHCDAFHVLDAACGVGYGSMILADGGASHVEAIDVAPEAIQSAAEYFARPNIRWRIADLENEPTFELVGAAVSFETIEHLSDPLPFLKSLRQAARQLFASVPNQQRLRFLKHRFPDHYRHYTPIEFLELLDAAGWHVDEWWHQKDSEPGVLHEGPDGRTMIVIAS